jgi:hypothetical protein
VNSPPSLCVCSVCSNPRKHSNHRGPRGVSQRRKTKKKHKKKVFSVRYVSVSVSRARTHALTHKFVVLPPSPKPAKSQLPLSRAAVRPIPFPPVCEMYPFVALVGCLYDGVSYWGGDTTKSHCAFSSPLYNTCTSMRHHIQRDGCSAITLKIPKKEEFLSHYLASRHPSLPVS